MSKPQDTKRPSGQASLCAIPQKHKADAAATARLIAAFDGTMRRVTPAE